MPLPRLHDHNTVVVVDDAGGVGIIGPCQGLDSTAVLLKVGSAKRTVADISHLLTMWPFFR